MNNSFSFSLDVLKAGKREGKPYVRIYATDTGADKVQDRMSEKCLRNMVEQISQGDVELVNSHHSALGFGKAVAGYVTDASQYDTSAEMVGEKALIVDILLDEDSHEAQALYKKALSGDKKIEFSVGGHLNSDNPNAVYFDRGCRVLNDVELDHITAARSNKAANSRTGICDAIFKTLDMSQGDLDQFAESSAPYTVRRMAKDLGISLGADAVEKDIDEAMFRGETDAAPGDDDGHTHDFFAVLDGRTGTLRGRVSNHSHGERHQHLIDLLDDEPAWTSGASRGEDHKHPLGMPTVETIMNAADIGGEEKVLYEEIKSNKLSFKHSIMEDEPMAEPKVDMAPPELDSSETLPPETQDDGVEARPEKLGFLQRFAGMFRAEETGPELLVDEALKGISEAGIPDDFDALVSKSLDLCREIASQVKSKDIDADALTVRSAKYLEAVESIADLRKSDHKVLVDPSEPEVEATLDSEVAEAKTVEDVVDPEAAPEVTPEKEVTEVVAKEEAPLITPEESDMTPEQKQEIVSEVSASVLEAFRAEGLLPAKTDAVEVVESKEDVVVDEAAPEAKAEEVVVEDAAKEEVVVDEAASEEVADEVVATKTEDTEVAKTLKAVADAIGAMSGKMDELGSRVAAVESAPRSSKSLDGFEAPSAKAEPESKGIFAGAFGNLEATKASLAEKPRRK